MTVTIALIGCLDTKGQELAYLKKILQEDGCGVHVVDTGVLDDPPFRPETARDEVAREGGDSLEGLRERRDRGRAVETMSRGAARIVARLHSEGAIHGVLAAGGSANTAIGTAAMRALAVGVPKMMVSTLASGDVSRYVDTKDVCLMYSVVDVAGINKISSRILSNAAHAVAAMARIRPPREVEDRPVIAATMFGVTTPCVTEARKILEEAGYEVLVFHATGTGGRAMEGLIEDGYIAGVLDVTTTELADEYVGGILSAGPRRLTAAAALGIPQVVSVGAVDMVNFGPRDTVPAKFAQRRLYQHSSGVTLMRTTPDENEEIGRRIADRVSLTRGPAKVLLPLRGVSAYSKEGGPFHDPEADARAIDAVRRELRPGIPVETLDTDINDPVFARACANALLELLRAVKPAE